MSTSACAWQAIPRSPRPAGNESSPPGKKNRPRPALPWGGVLESGGRRLVRVDRGGGPINSGRTNEAGGNQGGREYGKGRTLSEVELSVWRCGNQTATLCHQTCSGQPDWRGILSSIGHSGTDGRGCLSRAEAGTGPAFMNWTKSEGAAVTRFYAAPLGRTSWPHLGTNGSSDVPLDLPTAHSSGVADAAARARSRCRGFRRPTRRQESRSSSLT